MMDRRTRALITFALGVIALSVALWLMAQMAWAQVIAQRTVSQVISTSGSDCTVATSCVVLTDIFRTSIVSVQLAGFGTGTAQFEGTLDGTNWNALNMTPLGGGAAATSATGNGVWNAANVALQGARVRASALSNGTITVSIFAR